MHEVPLGTTGESVSALSLGTMLFDSGIDAETSTALLDAYYDAGGRFFDTANNYATWLEGYDEPRSEPFLGEWIDERGVREEVFVATKVGFNPPGVDRGLSPESIEREVEKSLERLGIDTIDLLYAHVDDFETPQADVMEAFQAQIDEGNVRHVGASNFLGWRVARANRIAEERGLTPYCCVQPRVSYFVPNRGADFGNQTVGTDELVHYCDHEELTILPYSPLLSGCYGRDDRPIPEGYVTTENRVKMDLLSEIAAERGVGENRIVLAWMIQRESPFVPVVGASTLEQLEENLAACDLELTDDELARLDGVENLGEL